MSFVTVQLGQCGNQIGGQLFKTLVEDLTSNNKSRHGGTKWSDYDNLCLESFFSPVDKSTSKPADQWKARAVLVDMESKVIAQTMAEAEKSGKWSYTSGGQVCQKRGSGNNWAHGFCQHGPQVEEKFHDVIQREVEKCDRHGGFLSLMSLAGGTGSGLGAYLARCLHDNYPNSFVINQVVWPYTSGEVAVQNYNAILSLAHLYQSADAILTFDNDSLHKICSQLLAIPKVSFNDLNQVISHKLASVFAPVSSLMPSESNSPLIYNHIGDFLEAVVPHPEYKLASIRCVPQVAEHSVAYTTYQWPGLLKRLHQMLVGNSALDEGMNWQIKPGSSLADRSVANLVITRGNNLSECDLSSFMDKRLYTDWCPVDSAFTAWSHPRSFQQHEKSAILVSNGRSVLGNVDSVLSRAWTMFASRAYVYQYQKYGLEEDDFVDSFACLEQVLANYGQL